MITFIFLLLTLFVYHPYLQATESFVTVSGNNFYLNGQVWHPFGINYFPLYVSNLPENSSWLDPKYYQSSEIERDLANIQSLGLNTISIQWTDNLNGNNTRFCTNLNDFLTRAVNHQLKANIYIQSCASSILPPYNDWKPETIEKNRQFCLQSLQECNLGNNNTIFAYDLLWEPTTGYNETRSWLSSYWEKWLIKNYDSLDNAKKVLEVTDLNTPNDNDLCSETVNRKASVYRRFVDDHVNSNMLRTTTAIKAIAPNHLTSYRGSTAWPCNYPPLNRRTDSIFNDFISPEIYEVSQKEYLGFATQIAGNQKPIVFAEYGVGISYGKNDWLYGCNEGTTNKKLQCQADAYTWQNQGFINNGAQGAISWWYGGFKTDGDWGIINPSTLELRQPVTDVLKNYSNLWKSTSNYQPNSTLIIDTDKFGSFTKFTNDAAQQWADLISQGKKPTIITDYTNKTSANTDIQCVGYLKGQYSPDGKYTRCPKKGLNSIFDSVEIKNSSGIWTKVVADNSTVNVLKGQIAEFRVKVYNTDEVKWLSHAYCSIPSDCIGYVFLGSYSGPWLRGSLPGDLTTSQSAVINATSETINNSSTITLSLLIEGQTWFGDSIKINLNPVATTPTSTPKPTNTPTKTPTSTPKPTNIPTLVPKATNTPTKSPSFTPKPTTTTKTGDANGDGIVNLIDFSIWKSEYLGILKTKTADFNHSSIVDLVDFILWKQAYVAH